jgi:hypothetical protein
MLFNKIRAARQADGRLVSVRYLPSVRLERRLCFMWQSSTAQPNTWQGALF